MRLFVLCIAILATLVSAIWCASDLYTSESVSFSAITTFLAALLAFLVYATMSGSKPVAPGASPHDLALFAEFQTTLPYEPTIRTLREADFGADYRAEWLDPLNRFVNEWDDPNREFLDAELEQERKVLYRTANNLAMDFARETVPNDHNAGWRTVYPWNQRGGQRPAHVLESAQVLNEASRAFVPIYDQFIRLARRRLNPTV